MLFLDPDYTAPMAALHQRVVLITGAGGSIGKVLAIACGVLQAEVIALGRSVASLEELHQQVIQQGGIAPRLYPMDLLGATPEDHDQLVQRIKSNHGRLDALIHCAALFNGLSPLEHTEPLDWLKVIQVNLNAPFLLTRSCLPLLRASDRGVVLFSDDCNSHEKAYWGAYAVAKAGSRALMQVLACETELDALNVFAIDPGRVATRLRRVAYPAANDTRWQSPEAIIGAYLRLLITPQANWHGQTVRVQHRVAANKETN